MTRKDQISAILAEHEKWLAGDGGKSANLSGANLSYADLCGADLRGANLHSANLHSANLHSANLHSANLHSADLHSANLCGADLRGANLRGANLHSANLRGANLRGANLHSADLHSAKGILLLPVQDTRGHSFAHAIQTEDGWRIRAGCRDFSITDARKHWGPTYSGDREQGDMYLYAVDWLERKLAAMEASK